ncbi:MAG: ParA family protein [Planctomycetes bacterium]|nr:ParA family protein [Planctomycetota bacterium]
MRCIIICNQKGGVGKTTTVANLGACLAERGREVLVVDADPQANLSLHFGVDLARGEPSLYTVMRGEDDPSDVVRQSAVEGLRILPTGVDLAGLGVELSGERGRLFALRGALEKLQQRHDYVLIDAPPSLGLLTLNAMCAAREVFIPMQTQFFALQGLGKLLRTVRKVRSAVNKRLRITGVLACMHDSRTCLAQETLDEIKKHFGRRVFKSVIRKNVRLAEAPGFGLPITEYDPECHGAQDYRALTREVIAMESAEQRRVEQSAPDAVGMLGPPRRDRRAG